MTELSPAAQAVKQAIKEACWLWDQMCPSVYTTIAAAALRAVADQVAPEHYSCYTGHGEFDFGMDARNDAIREALLAIAGELESH